MTNAIPASTTNNAAQGSWDWHDVFKTATWNIDSWRQIADPNTWPGALILGLVFFVGAWMAGRAARRVMVLSQSERDPSAVQNS